MEDREQAFAHTLIANVFFFSSSLLPLQFFKCKACTAAVNVRDRPVPCAKKSSHQYLENIMVPAIMSLWNQEQRIHLAMNTLFQKQTYVLAIWACAHWELIAWQK